MHTSKRSPKSVFAERRITEIVWQRVPCCRACKRKRLTTELVATVSWHGELMTTCRAKPLTERISIITLGHVVRNLSFMLIVFNNTVVVLYSWNLQMSEQTTSCRLPSGTPTRRPVDVSSTTSSATCCSLRRRRRSSAIRTSSSWFDSATWCVACGRQSSSATGRRQWTTRHWAPMTTHCGTTSRLTIDTAP